MTEKIFWDEIVPELFEDEYDEEEEWDDDDEFYFDDDLLETL
jgi:hypothetical protein